MDPDPPPDPFALKTIRFIIVVTFLVPLIVIGGCTALMMVVVFVTAVDNSGTWPTDRGAYLTLKTRMTQSDVENAFERAPDYECSLGEFLCLYYVDPAGVEDGGVDPSAYTFPGAVDSHRDLPYLYGAKQVLIDADQNVVAYTWIGQEVNIHTRFGDHSGAAIQELPDEIFNAFDE